MSKLLIYSQEDLDLILELLKEKNNELEQENKQLKDNWNKLKEYFKYEIEFDNNWYIPESKEYIMQKHFPDDTIEGFIYALNKMQELEKGENNE